MKRLLRLSSLALALLVTVALVVTTTPAQAQLQTPVAARATHAASIVGDHGDHGARGHVPATRTAKARPPSHGGPSATEHVKPFDPHVYYMGHDYCGSWLHGPAWCLTFNRIEAGYISAVSLATATAFICAGTALITCGIAAGIAAAIQRYVDRHGVCPSSRPKMRVEYFPSPGRVECV
jgi:hypothetical protein